MFGFFEDHIFYLVLHWVRCLAMTGTLSILGTSAGARALKVALGVMLGTMLALTGDPTVIEEPPTIPMMMALGAKEFLLGALFGWIGNIAFIVAAMAGQLVGEEMGFQMAAIQDPLMGQSVQVIAQIYELLAVGLFFSAGGHLFMMRCLARSFSVYGVESLSLDMELLTATAIYTSGIFVAALELSAPIFIALLLVGLVLALLTKVAPELHIMEFGFIVKILGGMLLIVATLPALLPAMERLFDEHTAVMEALLTAR
jgi:flagellar biosynthetic protein FliR